MSKNKGGGQMAVEIVRSLADIDLKVKELNKTLRSSSNETRELDRALKLDNKNVEAVGKKMNSLQTAVGTATQKVALLKQKQDEANKALQKGDISANEYKKIELAVLRAENQLKGLNNEISKTQKISLQQTTASFDKLTNSLNKAQSVAKTLSKVALGLVATLGATAMSFVNIGNELDTVSKKFRITAEELQVQRNLYQQTTGSASNFDSALTSLNKLMTSIAKGSSSYNEVLDKLGVSTVDSLGKQKSLSQVYAEVTNALSNVADENERAMLSSILFGSSGMYVAEVVGLSKTEVQEYNQALINNGIISSENAKKAKQVADAMNEVKQQLQQASAELMVALLPLILELVEIAKTTIIPILENVASWFANMSPEQMKFVFFLLTLVILLPKIISIISAIVGVIKAITIASYGAAGGIGAVSAASMPLLPIILAVSAAVLVLVLLFAMLAGKSKDVTGELNKQQRQFSAMQNQYSSMATDMSGTVAMTSSNSNTQTVNYDVNINASGDTAISQETAEMVADNLADKINAELGGKI